jgi:hypothetical protein
MITSTLKQRIFPLRVSPINSVATAAQAATAEANFSMLGWGFAQNVCPSLLPAGGFSTIFGQDTSDLIVSGTSQNATGLGYYGANPPTTISAGLIHSVDTSLFTNGPDALSSDVQNGVVVGVPTVNPQDVINLLNTPIGAGGFGQLLP